MHLNHKVTKCVLIIGFLNIWSIPTMAKSELEERTSALVQKITERIKPLMLDGGIAWWDAATTGSAEAYQRRAELDTQLDLVFADREMFSKIKELRTEIQNSDEKINPFLKRQIDRLYLSFLGKQVDPTLLKEITELSAKIEKSFNTYRGEIDGRSLTENELKEILKKSNDSNKVQKAWEAGKGVAKLVESDLKDLVRKRNRIAQLLDFKNYHDMALRLDEHDPEELTKLMDELDMLTRDLFAKEKKEIDTALAKQFNIDIQELRPWHFRDPFFQQPPDVYPVSLDILYKNPDQIISISKDFYQGIGLPVDAVLEKSDLFPRSKKSQHAFCTDIDRSGDTRVLANVVGNEEWMSVMLHELGHAVYSGINFPKELPFLLRDAAHTLTTEGFAMMIDRQTKVPAWMESVGIAPEEDAIRAQIFDSAQKLLRHRLLIFSRWAQVMYRFEKGLYADPEQNLNKLWWDLVEEFQLMKKPEGRDEPDYASKIHIVVAPVYYHNYALGDLFASQLHHSIAKDLGVNPHGFSYANNKKVGELIQKKLIDPGASLPWNELTEFATGEKLNPKAFAEDMK